MIRLSGGFAGPDPDTVLRAEMSIVGSAVRAGVGGATDGLKDDLRAQIRSAGFGTQLSNAVGANLYPTRGGSLHTAGMVFPRGKKAQAIFESFNDATIIVSKTGKQLALATPNAFLGGRGGHRPSPAEFERRTGIKLHVVASKKPGVSLLMGARNKERIRRGGRLVRDQLVYFVLLPFTQNNRRLTFDAIARKWADRIPEFIESALPQGLR